MKNTSFNLIDMLLLYPSCIKMQYFFSFNKFTDRVFLGLSPCKLKCDGYIPVILQIACALAALIHPSHLL